MKLTKNFNLKEFECKGGGKMPLEAYENIIKLASQLQFLRDYTGRAIRINSGFRSESHNQDIGGVPNSRHLLGQAADITIDGLNPSQVFALIEELIDMGLMIQGGLGNYNNFTHYDIRRTKARWNG